MIENHWKFCKKSTEMREKCRKMIKNDVKMSKKSLNWPNSVKKESSKIEWKFKMGIKRTKLIKNHERMLKI